MKEIEPINFPQVNTSLQAPPGEEDLCDDLPCWRDGKLVISCWKIPFWQRVRLLFTGKIWLGAQGLSQPPIWLTSKTPWDKK